MKPTKAIEGPTTTRRVLNMSGLNAVSVELPPSMSRNPATMTAPAIAMNMKLLFSNGKSARLSRSIWSWDALSDVICCCFIEVSVRGLLEHAVVVEPYVLVGGKEGREGADEDAGDHHAAKHPCGVNPCDGTHHRGVERAAVVERHRQQRYGYQGGHDAVEDVARHKRGAV